VYFDECFGVIAGDGTNVENVKLKVSAGQANYLRSLPLHHSQQEIQQTEEYSIFELRIRPTFDFYQEILRNGEDVEVLEPLWFRKEIAGIIEKMWNKYSLSH
jgi:predicted DNA-binding transcriptional regulator YafY